MRLRATVGEVSDALEKIFGRFRATHQTVSGVYGAGRRRHRKLGMR
jgi:methylmalonyl-CoA mutase